VQRKREEQTPLTTYEKQEENVRKLREMIKGIEFAMLTTVEDDGCLRRERETRAERHGVIVKRGESDEVTIGY
jgi:hypothetical protein